MSWLAAVEAGGTKFLCASADVAGHIQHQARFATRDPETTLAEVVDFFRPQIAQYGPPNALGIASFGPLDLDQQSATYGHISHTPKPGWRHFDLLGQLQQALNCPATLDTDVNAAALAEYRWGAGQQCDPLIYLTVGTGVGGGVVVQGRPLRGLIHPEMGHLRVVRLPDDDFPGACPFHDDCVEGLCSGPALRVRQNLAPEHWPADDPEWQRLSEYLGRFVAQLLLCFSPRRILIGGGVISGAAQSGLALLPAIRRSALNELGGYLQHSQLQADGHWLCAPALEHPGLHGAVALALDFTRTQFSAENTQVAAPAAGSNSP